MRTVLNGKYELVPNKAKLFAKSGGRPVYQNTRWKVYYLHYVEEEENWYFTEVHTQNGQFAQYPSAFVNFKLPSLTPDTYEVRIILLIYINK